jgi:hypothetical protein
MYLGVYSKWSQYFFGRVSIIFYPETRNPNRNLNRTRIFAFCVMDGEADYDYD